MSYCTTDKSAGTKSPAPAALLRRTRDHSPIKAAVRIEARNGALAFVKDFSACHPLVRCLYGRIQLWREARAYARLCGIDGVPRFLGRVGTYAIAFEYIAGRPLTAFKRGAVPAAVFGRLEQTLQGMHARGVAHADLHRANILVSDSGMVYIVDFATALIARNPVRPGPVFRMCRQLDYNAVARMRARFFRTKKPRPEGLLGLFYAAGKLFRKIGKRIF